MMNKNGLVLAALKGMSVVVLAMAGCSDEGQDIPKVGQSRVMEAANESAAPPAVVHKEVGEASWYGPGFHGKETASGEPFDQNKLTAAHPTLPLGTEAKVTNLENKKKVEVEITDRGPYAEDRAIDLSKAAAKKLDLKKQGVGKVRIEAVVPADKQRKAGKQAAAKSPSKTHRKHAAGTSKIAGR